MHTIDLAYVGRGIHEELVAYVADHAHEIPPPVHGRAIPPARGAGIRRVATGRRPGRTPGGLQGRLATSGAGGASG